MTKENKLLVAAIKNGTVIDHITAGQALKIIRLLNLPEYEKRVTVGLNLPSRAMGKKDLIKVEGKELAQEDVNRVAIFSPQSTINIIKDYKIIKKFQAEIPEMIEYVIVCPNPKCITNNEKMSSRFHVIVKRGKTKLKCHYCEKAFDRDEIREYKNN